MTPQQQQERTIQLYERVRDATMDVLKDELTASGTLPAGLLLLGAAAAAGATIDLIEMQTGGKIRREAALGMFVQYLITVGMEHPTPPEIPN